MPTLAEQGYPDIALQEWLGWFVPAKTPTDVVQAPERAGARGPAVARAAGGARQERACVAQHQSPEEFAALLKADIAHWGPIVKATGFKAEE